jgi:N-acetylmuramoyl-L-alanine amidase
MRKWIRIFIVLVTLEAVMGMSVPQKDVYIDPNLPGSLLKGRTVILDPGHGGKDPGARGLIAQEDQVNLAVALDLRQWLQDSGAKVKMTWEKPGQIPSFKKYRVYQRVKWINRTQGNALIDIHCNSAGSRWSGPQTFYWDGTSSYHLAYDVQKELQYFTHTKRRVARIDQYVLRYARMPAINVELGFISNPQEERLLANPGYQRELSWYIFLGIEQWFLKGRLPEHVLKSPPPGHLLIPG